MEGSAWRQRVSLSGWGGCPRWGGTGKALDPPVCRGRDWASREDTAPRTGLGKGAPVQGKWELVSRVQRDPVGLPLSPDPTGVALLPAAAPPRASVAGLSGHGGGGCSVLLTERLLYTKRGVYANSTQIGRAHV